MTLFVLGAGATRGCSFVSSQEDPCLPPLDGDFFMQLQRSLKAKTRVLSFDYLSAIVAADPGLWRIQCHFQ